jgi:5,10-methylenetetrahydromethanopterin reductase
MLPSYRAMLDREGATGPSDVALVGSAGQVSDSIASLASAGVTDFVAVEFSGDRSVREATRETLVSLLGR